MKKAILLTALSATLASAGVVRFTAKAAYHAPKYAAKAVVKTVRFAGKVLY